MLLLVAVKVLLFVFAVVFGCRCCLLMSVLFAVVMMLLFGV